MFPAAGLENFGVSASICPDTSQRRLISPFSGEVACVPVPVGEISVPSALQVVIAPCQAFPARGQVPGLRDRPFLCACCSCQTGLERRICLLSPCHGQSLQGRAAWPRLHHLLLRNQVLQWDKPPYSLPSLNSFFPAHWPFTSHWENDLRVALMLMLVPDLSQEQPCAPWGLPWLPLK